MSRAKTHQDVEFHVDAVTQRMSRHGLVTSSDQRVFHNFNAAAGLAVAVSLGTRKRVDLDVVIWSRAGASWYMGDDGVEMYNEDPEASVFERFQLTATSNRPDWHTPEMERLGGGVDFRVLAPDGKEREFKDADEAAAFATTVAVSGRTGVIEVYAYSARSAQQYAEDAGVDVYEQKRASRGNAALFAIERIEVRVNAQGRVP